MSRARWMKVDLRLIFGPLAITPKLKHDFCLDRFEIVPRLPPGSTLLIPDVETDGVEHLAPCVAAIPIATISGPAIPETVRDRLDGDAYIDRLEANVDHVEFRPRPGGSIAEAGATEGSLDGEALLGHGERIVLGG